jgi:hypothetical protein
VAIPHWVIFAASKKGEKENQSRQDCKDLLIETTQGYKAKI